MTEQELIIRARTNPDKVDWFRISEYQTLSEDFIREFQDKVDWYWISVHQILSEDFIREVQDKVNWACISYNQKLSEDFIREFQDKVDWSWISCNQILSEDFIREFQDKVDWGWISKYQKLSEDFIREFQDKVYWEWISQHQVLSEDFIREFQNKVNWDEISKYQKLSDEFFEEFQDKLPKPSENNWLYVSNEVKKKAIEDCGLYEMDGDFVIAYKGIRSNNYSKFNFQYKYEIGNVYESHCDCNNEEENSFGLSAWTLKRAKEYCNEKIIKVKIHISDIGALVHNYHKIRCFKFEVLEEVPHNSEQT
jgi:hypothetical protein